MQDREILISLKPPTTGFYSWSFFFIFGVEASIYFPSFYSVPDFIYTIRLSLSYIFHSSFFQ